MLKLVCGIIKTMTRQEYMRKYYQKHRSKLIAQARERKTKYTKEGRYTNKQKQWERNYRLSGKRKKYAWIWVNGRSKPLHRYLIEQKLGRQLSRDEEVHHLDGNPLNNKLSNLAIMLRSAHHKYHKPIIHPSI